MQPWHCVLIIVITLSLFFYGAYYQDIQDESQMPLTLSYEENFSEPDPGVREGPESTPGERASETFADSDHWAEHRVLLVVENGTPILTSLHSDALQSPVFLDKLIEFLEENPTAKELILSPFQSNAFKENETQILRPLFLPVLPKTGKMGSIWCAVAIPSKVHDS